MTNPPLAVRESLVRHPVWAVWHSPFLTAGILFGIVLPFYLIPPHGWNSSPASDTVPAELMPIAILKYHSLDFNRLIQDRPTLADPNHLPNYLTLRNGKIVSFYPLVPGLMNLPVYAVADHFGCDLFRYRLMLSHLTSCLISALSTSLMFLALDAVCSRRRVAIGMAILFALGTEVWSEASRGMWQHGPSILLLTGIMAILLHRWGRGIPLAGVLMGMAIWNRPTNVLIVAPLVVYVAFTYRRHIASFLCALAVPLLFMSIYSYLYLGSVAYLGQGRSAAADIAAGGMLRAGLIPGLEGLIFSPNRGLLVFTPVFAFGLAYLVCASFSRRENPLFRYLFAGVILMLLCYGHWSIWWGGYCFGYRLLSELIPILILATAMAWQRWLARLRVGRWAFALLAGWSIYVNFLGAVYYHWGGFNWSPNSIDKNPARLWNVKDGEIARDQDFFIADLEKVFTGNDPRVESPKPLDRDEVSL